MLDTLDMVVMVYAREVESDRYPGSEVKAEHVRELVGLLALGFDGQTAKPEVRLLPAAEPVVSVVQNLVIGGVEKTRPILRPRPVPTL